MKNSVIIIPSRLAAKRFPNKPLATINGLPMIVHVLNRAKESNIGKVLVATPDNEIFKIVEKNGGEAFLTKGIHASGSDRIFEAFNEKFKNNADLIINLQGDMPNINPQSILNLEKNMRKSGSDIGTLASVLDEGDVENSNVTKVLVEADLTNDNFIEAKDFFRIKKDLKNHKIYHHIGIYAFTNDALTKYVRFPRSKLEKERDLEQMRAMENNMIIKVALSDSVPLGVDTEESLKKVSEEMKKI